MYGYLTAGGFDTVICTHVFSAIALTELLHHHSLEAQTAFVDTDYTFSPGTQSTRLQSYFVPSEALKSDSDNNIPVDHHTAVTGIPVRSGFWTSLDKTEARRRLHMGAESRHLLMMCGSMGCGPIVKLLERVATRFPPTSRSP